MKVFFILLIIFSFSVVSSAQWTFQYVLPDLGPYPAVSVYAPNELVAAGGGINTPRVYKSTDGGTTWINISGNLTGPKIFSIWAVNENLIFAGDGGSLSGFGGNAKMWKTTNGGLNWSIVLSTGGIYGFFNGIVFSRTDPSFGIAMSDTPTDSNFFLAKTKDGGSTWEIIDDAPSGTGLNGVLGSVVCIDSLYYGWGIGPYNARVMFTSNGGNTWVTRSINLTGSNYTTGFAISDDKITGIAVGDGSFPNISRTTNGGNTWSLINTNLAFGNTEFSRIKWVSGTDVCYITSVSGSNGCIGKSTNAGLNWSVMNTEGFEGVMALDVITLNDENSGYAITGYGEVLKLQEPVSVSVISSNIPKEYRLEQNYPNPFNPFTTIRFQVLKMGLTTIIVYDIMGREITRLVNDELIPGTYEVHWNGNNFSSGVYFYKLASGNITITKKMLLIK